MINIFILLSLLFLSFAPLFWTVSPDRFGLKSSIFVAMIGIIMLVIGSVT